MTTKTKKLPDGMAELLDRVGSDTQTSRLCIADDYPAALEHVRYVMGLDAVTVPILDNMNNPTPEREATGEYRFGAFSFLERDLDNEVRATRQSATNQPRADAYTLLVAMLEGLVDV